MVSSLLSSFTVPSSFIIFLLLLLSINRLFHHVILIGLLINREGLGVRLPIMLGVVAIVVLRSHHNLVGDQEGQVEPQTWPMRPLTHLTSR